MFLEFLRTAKTQLNSETEKAMFKYLEEIYNFAVKSQKKTEKRKTKISTWISQDLEIDQARKRAEEAGRNAFPHPVKK